MPCRRLVSIIHSSGGLEKQLLLPGNLNMNYMKMLLIIYCFLGSFFWLHAQSTDTLFVKKNVGLVLSNPGMKNKFFVSGEISLFSDHLVFKVDQDSSFLKDKKKIYRYNYLIKDIKIPYHQIKNINKGVFTVALLFVVPGKLEVELNNNVTYTFDIRKDRKKIIEIVQLQSKNNSGAKQQKY